jgi:ribonuclease-3
MKHSVLPHQERLLQLRQLATILALDFSDLVLLHQSLIHPSYAQEHGHPLHDNQRLEFLGDGVLELLVTSWLYHYFPEHHEGQMTMKKPDFLSENALAYVAKQWQLGSYLLLGKGERLTGGQDRPSLLADAVEAILGCCFLVFGYDITASWFMSHMLPLLQEYSITQDKVLNHKGILQEYMQKKGLSIPIYQLTGTSGPEHQRTFCVTISHNGKVWAQGYGNNKKTAEQQAAQQAYTLLLKGKL